MEMTTQAQLEPAAETTETLWDSVIVGGGAAGLSAGIVLARAQFATLVVDGGAPRNGPAEHMHGYLSRDGMAPKEFLATGRDELTRYGGRVLRTAATDARRPGDGGFEVRLDDERALRARSLLVATGLTDELPDIPGLSEGWATRVHHCPHCHGYEVRGRTIAVIGGTMRPQSAHLAALMRRYSGSVTFFTNGAVIGPVERQRLTAYGVRLVDARVKQVVTAAAEIRTLGAAPVWIELDNAEAVGCEAVFVAPRPVPHDVLLTTLGAARDPAGELVSADATGATTVDGLWAAGNVVSPRAQVIAAAAAGATAGIAMTSWLLEHELSAGASIDRGPSS